jgi:hypothetical protein
MDILSNRNHTTTGEVNADSIWKRIRFKEGQEVKGVCWEVEEGND